MDDNTKKMLMAAGVGVGATAVVATAMYFLGGREVPKVPSLAEMTGFAKRELWFGAMSQDEYTAAVMAQLPEIDPEELKFVLMGCAQSQREGFSVDDAARYLRCTEHVNPDLDEDIALARMAKIRSKYITLEGVRKST